MGSSPRLRVGPCWWPTHLALAHVTLSLRPFAIPSISIIASSSAACARQQCRRHGWHTRQLDKSVRLDEAKSRDAVFSDCRTRAWDLSRLGCICTCSPSPTSYRTLSVSLRRPVVGHLLIVISHWHLVPEGLRVPFVSPCCYCCCCYYYNSRLYCTFRSLRRLVHIVITAHSSGRQISGRTFSQRLFATPIQPLIIL